MWSNIVKKTPVKKSDNPRVNKVSQKQTISNEPTKTIGYRNADEMFEMLYSSNIDNSVVEFRDYLENSQMLVYPNNRLTTELYKFVKYNCYNVDSVINDVERFNDELDREIEEEEEEYE